MSEYTPTTDVPDEVIGLMAASVKATVRTFPGHVSDRMAEQIARSALHALTPWLAAHDREVWDKVRAVVAEQHPRCTDPCEMCAEMDDWLHALDDRIERGDG